MNEDTVRTLILTTKTSDGFPPDDIPHFAVIELTQARIATIKDTTQAARNLLANTLPSLSALELHDAFNRREPQ